MKGPASDFKTEYPWQHEDYESAAAADAFLFLPKEGRVDELKAAAQLMLVNRQILAALSFRGKLLHLSATMPLRVGRGFMQGLNQIISQDSHWSDLAEDNLHFILAVLDLDLCKSIPLCPTPVREFRVWVDASAKPGPKGDIVQICALAFDLTSGWKRGAVSVLPQETIQHLCPRASQILVGELCGPMLAAFCFPSVFKDASGIVYIDNMSVLCGIVNGSMGAPDLANAVFGLHWRLALLNSTCFGRGSPVSPMLPTVAPESVLPAKWPVSFAAPGTGRLAGVACELPRALPVDWAKFWK